MRSYVIALGVAVAFALVACNKDSAQAREPTISSPQENVATSSPEMSMGDGAPAIGAKAPSITVANSTNIDGTVPNLDDYLGQVVVLDFWAYW